MDQTKNYAHLVFKKVEGALLFPKVVDLFKDRPCFGVEELGDEGVHYHLLVDTPWDEKKVRREVDKLRPEKAREFSYRNWKGTIYLCKGASPVDLPVVKVNTLPDFTDDNVKELHDQWWKHHHGDSDKDPDFKETPVLTELVDWARGNDVTVDQTIEKMIQLYEERGGKKALCNRSNGQNYVRTALLFSAHADYYRGKLRAFYRQGLFE